MGRSTIACVAALGLATCLGGAADADPIDPAKLMPALGVYVDAIAADHAAALACAKPDSQTRDDGAWNAAKAIFIATLWANGFPSDFVSEARSRLDAPPAALPDCSDTWMSERVRDPDREGWPAYLAHSLSGMDLKPVFPLTQERWQAVKDAVASELPLQRRIFACLAAASPEFLPLAVHDWDQMIDGIGLKLAAAGVPRDELATTIGGAEANALWQRAAVGDVAALKADCIRNTAWSDRFFGLKYLSLAGTIDGILPPVPPGQ